MKKKMIFTTFSEQMGDMTTPVILYSKIRMHFAESILFESSEYEGKENHYSFICFDPLYKIVVSEKQINLHHKNTILNQYSIPFAQSPASILNDLYATFEFDQSLLPVLQPFFAGYIQYDAVSIMDRHTLQGESPLDIHFPLIQFTLFKNIIVYDHYYKKLYAVRHATEHPEPPLSISPFLNGKIDSGFRFHVTGAEESSFTREELRNMIGKVQRHVYRGDVFQIVPSCPFTIPYQGDPFSVYRHLRSINPSPYLFYCDYGSFTLFGSSPEAQLKIQNGRAVIHPIAGTIQRSGNTFSDAARMEALIASEKENSEHVMLVDLARNDLSRYGYDVKVDRFKEVQYYSHVIHLVSQVSAAVDTSTGPWDIIFNTFPAGTLTGAPKFKAIDLIEHYEKTKRLFYGGAVGMISLSGDTNLAIIIRSALAVRNTLYFQAGAGVVADSIPEKEVEEIMHKTNSMRQAIQTAHTQEAEYV